MRDIEEANKRKVKVDPAMSKNIFFDAMLEI